MREALNPKRCRLLDFQFQPREAPRDSSGVSVARRPPCSTGRASASNDTSVEAGLCGVLGAAYAHVWLRVRVVWAKESGAGGTVESAGAGNVPCGF